MASGATSRVDATLARAWRLRLQLQADQAQDAYVALREALSLPRSTLAPAAGWTDGKSVETLALARDVVLLGGSLARLQGRREKTLSAATWVEDLVQRFDGLDDGFYLPLERGIRAHIGGDFETALRLFTDASTAAEEGWQLAVSLINVLTEMKLLGLDARATLARLNTVCGELPPAEQIEAITRQLGLHNARAAFHGGEARRAADAPEDAGTDQARCFRLWVRSLPYTRAYAPARDDELEDLLVGPSDVYQRLYVSRTLRGVLHPDDLGSFMPYDAVDRFYLWTWRWLLSPEKFPIHDALKTLEALAPWSRRDQLTFDDRQLVTNGLLWIGLFGCEPLERMQALACRVEAGAPRTATVLRYEQRVIEWAYAVRDGDEAGADAVAAELAVDPMTMRGDLLFGELLQPVAGSRMAPLLGALTRLAREARAEPDVLTVNVLQSLVTPRRGAAADGPVLSGPMARLLAVLREKEVVSCPDLLAHAFGIGASSYDPLVHERKIFNLLARAKPLLPDGLSLRVKSGYVVASGRWDAVRVIGVGARATQLADDEAWRRLVAGGRPAGGAEDVRPPGVRNAQPAAAPTAAPRRIGALSAKTIYTRSQLERICGKPRSTMARLLDGLVRDGLVRRTGRARATSYQILEPEQVTRRLEGATWEAG